MAPAKAARPIVRLARAAESSAQLAMSVAFLLAAGFLAYAAASGVRLGLGKHVMASSHVLWSAALCLTFGFGMLLRKGPGQRAAQHVGSKPERTATATTKAGGAGSRRSASKGSAAQKASTKRSTPRHEAADAS